MNLDLLTRTVTLINARSQQIKAVLEPFWCEFNVEPGDQIEFRGKGGDSEGVYLVELVEGYVLLWEWDASFNEVRLNGNLVSDWSKPSPVLFGEWKKRMKEKESGKSVIELLREAHERADVDIEHYPFTSVCMVQTELIDYIFSDRIADITLTMEPDLPYIVEIQTKTPAPIRLLVNGTGLALVASEESKSVIWQPVDGESGPEIARVW